MSYPTEVQGWKALVPDKWVIFDADAIISILAFEQQFILDELKELGAKFVHNNPVMLELMNTDNPKEKLRRSKVIVDYDFVELPLHNEEIALASKIQESLPLKCQPSPTDLYLGGSLAKHRRNSLLLTANIKDFPAPLYIRKGHILLQNDHRLKVLSLLSTDNTKLVDA